MEITINTSDPRPIYRQVADEIRKLIANGELRENAALPPVRQLAADLGVNMNTIATAYRELQDQGLVAVRHGSGAVVTSRRTPAAHRPSREDLRRNVRLALAQMLLAGMKRGEILGLITDELSTLLKGAK